mmetsp:Transcript_34483/g.67882  ORF Transcript_34483/g.67882 Transcript_34483/m.67882 type:complete len:200 (-) Transcript_34483:699-1298(-)
MESWPKLAKTPLFVAPHYTRLLTLTTRSISRAETTCGPCCLSSSTLFAETCLGGTRKSTGPKWLLPRRSFAEATRHLPVCTLSCKPSCAICTPCSTTTHRTTLSWQTCCWNCPNSHLSTSFSTGSGSLLHHLLCRHLFLHCHQQTHPVPFLPLSLYLPPMSRPPRPPPTPLLHSYPLLPSLPPRWIAGQTPLLLPQPPT